MRGKIRFKLLPPRPDHIFAPGCKSSRERDREGIDEVNVHPVVVSGRVLATMSFFWVDFFGTLKVAFARNDLWKERLNAFAQCVTHNQADAAIV